MNAAITTKNITRNCFCILLVDDRPENLLTLENVIEKEGRHILKANSGNEALKIALSEKVDLILLDVQMPEMDGYEVAELLRINTKTKNIPIIFVSAVNMDEKVPVNKFKEGTTEFLFKPLDIYDTKSKVVLFEKIYLAELEKKTCIEKLELAVKEMDVFVYTVSHDIKTPLRAIENLVTWIEDDLAGAEAPDVQKNISLLKNRVSRMQNLLDGVTEYSRVGRINEIKEMLNMNKLVQYIIETVSPPPGFKLIVQENLPVLFAEKTKLIKILTHLINNSIVHHHKTEGYINISALDINDKVQFTIHDDGPGIKPQYFEKVFEIFHTLVPKDKCETCGAGLAIVKKLIDSNGEKIWFEPVATGTKINFTWKK
jgi:two-component system sensor histidine kinase/response regulator